MDETIAECGRCGKRNAPRTTAYVGFSGDLKAYVQSTICQGCWNDWTNTQLMAINEYRLNLGRPEHRQVLHDLASEFLRFGADTDPARSDHAQDALGKLDEVWTPPKDPSEHP